MPYKDIRKRRKYDREHKRKIYPKALTQISNLNSNPKNYKYEDGNDRTEGLINGLDKKDGTFTPKKPILTAEQKLKYAKWGITV
jgi:hypothetical protein